MILRLIDPATATEEDWPVGSQRLRAYVEAFTRDGSQLLIANLRTRVVALLAGDLALPVTINDAEYDNSYVCSLYTALALYSKDEMRLLPRLLRGPLRGLANVSGVALKAARINQMVQVNNWMLSTNLFPRPASGGPAIPIAAITDLLVAACPDHVICFRSLNAWDNAALCDQFTQAGYKLAATRQVYIYDRLDETWLPRTNTRHDLRLLRHSPYRLVPHAELGEADYGRMAELYEMLYLRKYSHFNPAFTSAYMRLCHREGVMRFLGLRQPGGPLDGIVGLFAVDSTVTAPVVGYDTTRDRRLGLYRLLMTHIFQAAITERQNINLSSGAASFKRLRGGQPFIEYSAIYDRHLSAGRRLAVSGLAATVNTLGVPLLRRLKL